MAAKLWLVSLSLRESLQLIWSLRSLHRWRKTTCAGKHEGYFNFAPVKLCIHINIYYIFTLRMCYKTLFEFWAQLSSHYLT